MILRGSLSFRGASNSLIISREVIPELNDYDAPSYNTIKNWLQQVGYYKLIKQKARSNDWMVLIDASIQMGEQKCVLAVGCPNSTMPKGRALKLEDLEVLSVNVVSSVDADVIHSILNKVQGSVGEIISICTDRGSDMLKGVKLFKQENSRIRHISDTAHRVANFLERTLEKSNRWKEFRKQATLARRKMQNSVVAGAQPPSPRTKARYMNVDSLIKWAADMIILLDCTPRIINGLDIDELKKYLGWLKSYRDDIKHWNRLISISLVARELVRTEGIHTNIVESFDKALVNLQMDCRELVFIDQITNFLLEQSFQLAPAECYIGSTEILESLFGKIKHIEREQKAFGFTSLLFAGLASVGSSDQATIAEAMRVVKLSDIMKWTENNIGQSMQSKRRSTLMAVAELKAEAKIVGQKLSGALEQVAA